MVLDMPSFLEITSYIFFCNGAALGIFFEFSDYKRWIEKTEEYKNIPNPIIPSLILMFRGVVFTILWITLNPTFSIPFCWDPEFEKFSPMNRFGYYYVSMTVRRFFFYIPFLLSNGTVIACGLSYNGKDKKSGADKWDKIVSLYIMGVEGANSCMEMLKAWNHQVHLWLKFYVQLRLVTPGKRPSMMVSMSTFIVSAFWHGFYPFYYIMFFFAAFFQK